MSCVPSEKLRKPGLSGTLEHLYFTYTINFGLYMLEPWEVRLFNCTVLFMLMMSFYTFCIYFPPYFLEMMIYVGILKKDDVIKLDS